jgi:hypothetical protein
MFHSVEKQPAQKNGLAVSSSRRLPEGTGFRFPAIDNLSHG